VPACGSWPPASSSFKVAADEAHARVVLQVRRRRRAVGEA
jgi:hypothetical protein